MAVLELIGVAARSTYRYDDDPPGAPASQSVALDVAGLGRAIDDFPGYCRELFVPDGVVDLDRIAGLLGTALTGLVSLEHTGPDQPWIDSFMGGYAGDDPIRLAHLHLDRGGVPAGLTKVELVVGPHRPGNDPDVDAAACVVALRAVDLSPDPIDVGVGTVTISTPSASAGLAISATAPPALVADISGELSVTLDISAENAWRLFGADSGPRVELGGVAAALTFSPDDTDLALTIGLRDLALRLDSEGADSFLANLVAGAAATLDLDVTLSGRDGLLIDADPSLQVRIRRRSRSGRSPSRRSAPASASTAASSTSRCGLTAWPPSDRCACPSPTSGSRSPSGPGRPARTSRSRWGSTRRIAWPSPSKAATR